MVMGAAGNREATWTVQAVAPTEIHVMVMVRHDSISVMTTKDKHCGTKKSCTKYQPNHSIAYRNLLSQAAVFLPEWKRHLQRSR